MSGAIEAAHIVIVTGSMLYLNHRSLPPDLHPLWFAFTITVLAGLFCVAFAAIDLFRLIALGAG